MWYLGWYSICKKSQLSGEFFFLFFSPFFFLLLFPNSQPVSFPRLTEQQALESESVVDDEVQRAAQKEANTATKAENSAFALKVTQALLSKETVSYEVIEYELPPFFFNIR